MHFLSSPQHLLLFCDRLLIYPRSNLGFFPLDRFAKQHKIRNHMLLLLQAAYLPTIFLLGFRYLLHLFPEQLLTDRSAMLVGQDFLGLYLQICLCHPSQTKMFLQPIALELLNLERAPRLVFLPNQTRHTVQAQFSQTLEELQCVIWLSLLSTVVQ